MGLLKTRGEYVYRIHVVVLCRVVSWIPRGIQLFVDPLVPPSCSSVGNLWTTSLRQSIQSSVSSPPYSLQVTSEFPLSSNSRARSLAFVVWTSGTVRNELRETETRYGKISAWSLLYWNCDCRLYRRCENKMLGISAGSSSKQETIIAVKYDYAQFPVYTPDVLIPSLIALVYPCRAKRW